MAGRLPWSELGRRIEGLSGEVQLTATAQPGTCLNLASFWVQETVHAVVLRANALTMLVRTGGDDGVRWDDRSITVRYRTGPRSRAVFGLVATEGEPLFLPTPDAIDEGIDRTMRAWRRWSDAVDYDGEDADDLRRSVLVLKLLIMPPTGSVAAAGTMALPESLAGGKNWD